MCCLRVPFGVFSPLSQLDLPLRLRREAVSVYHSTNYMIPLPAFPRHRRGRIKAVTTLHDVIPLLFPGHAPRSRKARLFPLYVRLMHDVARRSHAIVTDSNASARDIAACLHLGAEDRARLHTVYCGVEPRFRPGPRPDAGAAGPRRVLYVGRCDPYKNLETLLRAFAGVAAELREPVELLVAGPPDPRYPEAPALARSLGIADRVRWTGYLSDDELVATYRRADLLAHPSRYEGFGLQIVEAMACGTPVVCSRAASLPEVAGDAAILLDPDDVDGFRRAILDVLRNPGTAARLSEKGLRQAARFTWEATARRMLAIYEQLGEPAS
jgi:alpha-1,3-rhamnosyl/mannosyltransferase